MVTADRSPTDLIGTRSGERSEVALDAVEAAVGDVRDPELPPMTLAMLGMIHEVSVAGAAVDVALLPTFAGCPATEMIERDVVTAVSAVDGVEAVRVRFVFDPPWTPARISPAGHDALREFGIAPPVGPGPDHPDDPTASPLPQPDDRTLPLLAGGTSSRPRACPYCDAIDTTRDGMFGPTPCRDVWFCNACQQPFEGFKS